VQRIVGGLVGSYPQERRVVPVPPVVPTLTMLQGMRAGSVIVDLTAEAGGNCELTRPEGPGGPGKRVQAHGVTNPGGAMGKEPVRGHRLRRMHRIAVTEI